MTLDPLCSLQHSFGDLLEIQLPWENVRFAEKMRRRRFQRKSSKITVIPVYTWDRKYFDDERIAEKRQGCFQRLVQQKLTMQGTVSCAYRLACSPWCTWERKCFCDQAGRSSESLKPYEFGFIHKYLCRFSLPHFSFSFLWGIAGRRAQESWVSQIRKLNERLPFSELPIQGGEF